MWSCLVGGGGAGGLLYKLDQPLNPHPHPPQSRFGTLEQEVKEINMNKQALKRNLLDLKELHHILEKTRMFFTEVETGAMRAQAAMETGEDTKGTPGTS